MSIKQKIGIGFGLFISLVFGGLLFSQKALAQGPAAPTVNLSNPHFTNGANIVINVNGNAVTFFDSNTGDNTRNFRPQNINTSVFCGSGINNYGVNIPSSASLTAPTVTGTLNLGFVAGTNCLPIPQSSINPSSIAIANPNGIAATGFIWQGNNIVSNGGVSFTPVSGSPTLPGGTPSVYFSQSLSGPCVDGIIILNGPNAGRIYILSDGFGSSISPSSPIFPYLHPFQRDQCKIVAERNITIAGTVGTTPQPVCDPATDPTCTPSGTVEPTCESGSFTSLEWIMCPLFNIAAYGANQLIVLFKDQLCFKVDASPTSPNATCDGKTTDTSSIKPAWSAIKNIVSALLVIIMLVAIFAQAASVGPIDAYTLRKLLPRLVAAVILIQISFYLFSWVVNVVDDIGEGLDSLLISIFPGEINNLNWLLGNARVGDGVAGPVSWLAVIGLIAFGVFALPAVLLGLFMAVIALLIGLAVLVFRKVLIIALLLIAPVALLLWVLPNTEKYWKMWWDNFLKVLLMFPIIVLLIEAGRIFAYAAGPATGGGFIGLFVVLVGFFGPLLLLPKTFRWGGTLMQMTGQGLERAGGSLGKPGKDYLEWRKGISRWNMARQTRRGILERRAKTDFAQGLSQGALSKLRRARLVGVSLHEKEVQRKALQASQAEVAKVYEEELNAANAELTQTVLPNFDRSQQDIVREAIALGQTKKVTDTTGRTFDFDGAKHIATHGELHQRAALDRAVVHGQWGVVDQYYTEATKSGDAKRMAAAEFFKNANAAALSENVPHILKGPSVAIKSGEAEISKMHGHEIESLLAEFSTKAAQGDAEAAQSLSGFLQRYQNARNNDTLRGNLDTRGITAVDAFSGAYRGDPAARATIDDINTGSLKKAKAVAEGKDPNDPLVDREGNRSRYQSPGLPPEKTIPLITIPGSPPPSGTIHITH